MYHPATALAKCSISPQKQSHIIIMIFLQLHCYINKDIYIESKIENKITKNKRKKNLKLIYQVVMWRRSCFCIGFIQWPKRWVFILCLIRCVDSTFPMAFNTPIIRALCIDVRKNFSLKVPTVNVVSGDQLFYEIRILRPEFSS